MSKSTVSRAALWARIKRMVAESERVRNVPVRIVQGKRINTNCIRYRAAQ